MAYWLLKTEPSVYSYTDLVGEKKAVWDGVSNNLALKHMRAMKKGDLALIYHSGDEKAIVGVAEVTSDPRLDAKRRDAKLVVVDLKPNKPLTRPVTLAEIKSKKQFSSFELVRLPRLSVMPVSVDQWKAIMVLAEHRMKGE